MAQTVYTAKGLIGGGADDLDLIDGASLLDGDLAFVFYGDKSYYYQLDDDSGLTEDSPWIITPDTNAGNKRWILKQGHVSERKNAIINGNLNIWQRETSFLSIASGSYCADRFRYDKAGVMVHDVTRDTDVPSSENFNYSMKIDCTTADTSIAATDYIAIQQNIEGYNFIPFVGKTATLSFWVKATKTGIHCVSFRNSGADRSYIAEYTINSSNTWEKKEITLTFDYSGGTWDFTNGIGIRITLSLVAGSTFQTTKDAWQTGNYFATSNQVNACDSVDNNFWITGIQFELGGVATEFVNRSFDQGLAMCQRYYEKSYGQSIFAGAINENGALYDTASGTGIGVVNMNAQFKVKKRTTPTISIYSPGTGTSGKIYNATGTADIAGDASTVNDSGIRIKNNAAAVDQNIYNVQWIAEAEL